MKVRRDSERGRRFCGERKVITNKSLVVNGGNEEKEGRRTI